MSHLPDFAKRVAVVTGGSRGIGRAIAIALANAGADVAVNYLTRAEEAQKVVEEICALGRRAIAVVGDVSQSAAVTQLFHKVRRELGEVDVLINNAGIATVRNVDNLTEAEFDETIAVNLKSVFLCTQAVLPAMRSRRWGRIVNVSSAAARSGGGIGPHYNASKAGIEGLARGYAARLAKEGITINSVAPAAIETEMIGPLREEFSRLVPLGRLGTAEEVADVVIMIIGNGYMTGQTVPVNGGMLFI